jgi:hypothetical protein
VVVAVYTFDDDPQAARVSAARAPVARRTKFFDIDRQRSRRPRE